MHFTIDVILDVEVIISFFDFTLVKGVTLGLTNLVMPSPSQHQHSDIHQLAGMRRE